MSPDPTSSEDTAMEDVESFRARARAWIRENLATAAAGSAAGVLRNNSTDEEELAQVAHERDLQRKLFDAGFAGICFPRAYGGQGLSPAHQQAFNEELTGHEFPVRIQAPTFSPCAAVILDFGTEEQKRAHLPAILRGDELWMQFLSEPGGGSDVAGAQTSAVRDGDEWVLNGSKVWTTGRLVVGLGPLPRPHQLGRAQAPRALGVHAADPPARRRGPPDRDAERHQGVLPGVHDRRPGPRLGPHRRRWTTAGPSGSAGCSTSACCTTPPT